MVNGSSVKYLELFDELCCLKVRQGTNILLMYC